MSLLPSDRYPFSKKWRNYGKIETRNGKQFFVPHEDTLVMFYTQQSGTDQGYIAPYEDYCTINSDRPCVRIEAKTGFSQDSLIELVFETDYNDGFRGLTSLSRKMIHGCTDVVLQSWDRPNRWVSNIDKILNECLPPIRVTPNIIPYQQFGEVKPVWEHKDGGKGIVLVSICFFNLGLFVGLNAGVSERVAKDYVRAFLKGVKDKFFCIGVKNNVERDVIPHFERLIDRYLAGRDNPVSISKYIEIESAIRLQNLENRKDKEIFENGDRHKRTVENLKYDYEEKIKKNENRVRELEQTVRNLEGYIEESKKNNNTKQNDTTNGIKPNTIKDELLSLIKMFGNYNDLIVIFEKIDIVLTNPKTNNRLSNFVIADNNLLVQYIDLDLSWNEEFIDAILVYFIPKRDGETNEENMDRIKIFLDFLNVVTVQFRKKYNK